MRTLNVIIGLQCSQTRILSKYSMKI